MHVSGLLRTAIYGSLVLALTSIAACIEPPGDQLGETSSALSASDPSSRAQLALRWAPVHFQDVDQTGSHALGGAADYITRYDYDGDLNGRNNWDNAGNPAFPLNAYVYYSVVETSTHWFLVYMFFHPRDWSDSFFAFDTEHENDSEGVMFAVRRDGSMFGQLEAAVTVAHSDFFSFVPSTGTWTANAETIDGTLNFMTLADGDHPVTAQQAKGHALKAWPTFDIVGDGVEYFPSATTAGVPTNPDDRNVPYALIDILAPGGLWDQRNNASLFASFGSFAGDKTGGCGSGTFGCDTNAANAPWGWDDHDDGPPRGALASDPAGLAANYFNIPEGIDTTYTFNPFH